MKQEITIRCPNCSVKIDINEALYGQLESQFNQETIEKRQAYKKAMDELHAKEQLIKTQEASFEQKLQEQLQLQLQTQRVKLNQEMQQELEKQQSQLKAQQKQMQVSAAKAAQEEMAQQLASLEDELTTKSKHIIDDENVEE